MKKAFILLIFDFKPFFCAESNVITGLVNTEYFISWSASEKFDDHLLLKERKEKKNNSNNFI